MNLRANDHGGFVTVHSSAVSDRTGNFTLYHPSGGDERANHGMAGAYAGAVSDNSEQFEVRCVRLDEYIRDTPGAPLPDVIKIDVEGGELAAIRGMSGLLGVAKPPAIIVEHNPATAAAAGFTPAELFRTLVQIQPGYEIFWIGRRLRRIADPATLDAITRQGNLLARLKS